MPIDYDNEYKNAFKANLRDTPRAVDAGELNQKIRNFCKLHGFDEDLVRSQIKNDKILAAFFAKNPKKQRFHEKLAAKFIEEIPGVENFVDLHNNSKVVNAGGVISAKELKNTGAVPKAKTIDFEWTYKSYQFYATHKHTSDKSGGAQDNAYKEIQTFIDEANKTTLNNTFFIAIADGEFYGYNNGAAQKPRIERLKDIANEKRVFACTINELEQLMIKLTK